MTYEEEELRYRRAHYSRNALRDECAKIRIAPSRRDGLSSGACSIYELVGGGSLPDDLAESKLTEAGLERDLTPYDTKRLIAWGRRIGLKSPRVPLLDPADIQDVTMRRCAIVDWYQIVMNDPSLSPAAKAIAWSITRVGLATGKTRLSLSLRQISLDSGLNLKTVQIQYKNLSNYLSIHNKGNRSTGKSITWQMTVGDSPLRTSGAELNTTRRRLEDTDKSCMYDYVPVGGETEYFSGQILGPSADIWMNRKLAWMIYQTLIGGARVGAKEMADILGVSDRAVRTNQAFLVKHGLIERMDDHTHEPISQTGVDLSEFVGGERIERLSERYQKDREALKVWQKHQAEVIASSKRRAEHKADFAQALRDSAGLVKPAGQTVSDVLGSGHATTSASQEGPGQEGESQDPVVV